MLQAVDRFGLQAVTGSPILYAGDIARMMHAEGAVRMISHYLNSKDQATWAMDHFRQFETILEYQALAKELGMIKND